MAENKMEQAATMNNFDKLIGKNGELAELRKEQVLAGAIGIIRRQYAGRSKMEAIAALFGKKLGEEFTAIIWDEMQKCKFTDEGLKVKYLDGDGHKSDNWLRCLLVGEAKIVEG